MNRVYVMGVVESISRVKFDYYNSLEANMFGIVREMSCSYVKSNKKQKLFENTFLFRIIGDMCGDCTRNINIGKLIYVVGSLRNTRGIKFDNNIYNLYINIDKIYLLNYN